MPEHVRDANYYVYHESTENDPVLGNGTESKLIWVDRDERNMSWRVVGLSLGYINDGYDYPFTRPHSPNNLCE